MCVCMASCRVSHLTFCEELFELCEGLKGPLTVHENNGILILEEAFDALAAARSRAKIVDEAHLSPGAPTVRTCQAGIIRHG